MELAKSASSASESRAALKRFMLSPLCGFCL